MKLSRPYNFRRPADAPPKSWYRIANVAADSVEIGLYDEIGMYGVSASDFVSELQAVDTGRITLRINSPGGDVFDGLAILNSLRNHRAVIDVVVDGLAASAASFIAQAGDTIKMSPNSVMMIHEASGICLGNASDMRELADLLDKTSANIANIYSRRSGRSAEEHRAAMRDETWYTDREAVDAGLADSVIGSVTDKTPVVVNDVPGIIESPVFNWNPEEFRRAFEGG
jgi:ATP-dependent Clp endopeptidase proteolytic subunit ClpP